MVGVNPVCDGEKPHRGERCAEWWAAAAAEAHGSLLGFVLHKYRNCLLFSFVSKSDSWFLILFTSSCWPKNLFRSSHRSFFWITLRFQWLQSYSCQQNVNTIYLMYMKEKYGRNSWISYLYKVKWESTIKLNQKCVLIEWLHVSQRFLTLSSNLSETGYFFNSISNSLNLGQTVMQKSCLFRMLHLKILKFLSWTIQ